MLLGLWSLSTLFPIGLSKDSTEFYNGFLGLSDHLDSRRKYLSGFGAPEFILTLRVENGI